MKKARSYGRRANQLRPVKIKTAVNMHAEGSVLIKAGNTEVLCTASVEERVPPFLRGQGKGWVTAEYSMLPRATTTRSRREATAGKQSGRTTEIQRLIGRALRSVVDLNKLGEISVLIDCDVIQADGGTRCASITGGFVAMHIAMQKLVKEGKLPKIPITDFLAAVSVGIVDGKAVLDLDYAEDSNADTDMNLVMTARGKFVEIQGTAEEAPFDGDELEQMIALGKKGIKELVKAQKAAL